MNETPPPLERLASDIKRQVELVGSFNALEKKTSVDRRKLKRLAEEKNVRLTMSELNDLNEFLSARGGGLAIAFSPAGIVRQIAEHGEVTFILGSQPDQAHRRIDLSRWDIRSLREVLDAMNATGRAVRFRIEDVIYRKKAETAFGRGRRVAENESWYHCLTDEGPSVVCIGSPKACHASEVMLAKMMNVEEFGAWPAGQAAPFFFIWPDTDPRAREIKSAFKRTSRQLAGYAGVTKDFIRGLKQDQSPICGLYDGELRAILRIGHEWDTYGVIAVQRRPGNQYWVVLAGATGPATLGAARVIRDFVADLPVIASTRCSKMVWAVVKVHVQEQKGADDRQDERHITGRPALGAYNEWSP